MSNKTKAEQQSASLLRTPKAKNKLGLKVPTIAMPHEDLIHAEQPAEQVPEKPHLEIVPSSTTLPSQTRRSSQSSVSSQTRQSNPSTSDEKEIAPTKNYQKVPNSITKLAIPEGLFVGKSKQLYDVLYGLTRGAIQPARKIRISKTKLMKQSGIGSRITFDSCIVRLQTVGLLNLKIYPGEHEGNEFEIFLPEELATLPSQSSQSTHTSQSSQASMGTLTSPAQKLDRLVSLETRQTSQSLNRADTTNYENSKTSFKTNTTDDEENLAFSGLTDVLKAANERLTGRKTNLRDAEKWRTLGELLILELDIAARRAGQISNVPAFLTEVLRRKLMNQPVSPANPKKAKIDKVGKGASGEYEVKSLDEKGREAALGELREFADDDFLQDFKKWYTPDDWEWLVTNIKSK